MRKIAERAVTALKTLLPNAHLSQNTSQNLSDWDRAQGRLIFSEIGDMFARHPVLFALRITATVRQDGDGYRVTQIIAAAFDFAVCIDDNNVFVAQMTDAEQIAVAFQQPIDDRLGGFPMFLTWIDACSACGNVIGDFNSKSKEYLEEQTDFWERGGMVVNRYQYDASKLNGILDVDALLNRVKMGDLNMYGAQADLTGAPAFWNEATMATIPARLSAGMGVHVCDSDGLSALVAAAAMGKKDLVEVLLNAGADPDQVDCTGFNGVTAALAAGEVGIFNELVEAGGDPNGPRTLPSLLVSVCTSNPVMTLAAAIDAGSDLRGAMPDGRAFNESIDSLIEDFSVGSDLQRELLELMRSRTTELEVQNALGSHTGLPKVVKSKSALAL